MEFYKPGLVYQNVRAMLKNRGGTITDNELSESDIIQQMNHNDHVTVSAVRGAEDIRGAVVMIAIIIDVNSKISKNTQNLSKILINALRLKKPNVPLEILLITEVVMQDRLLKKDDVKEFEDVVITNHPYVIFLLDITKHVSAPKHEIMSDAEVSAFCRRYHTTKENFSKIPASDPQSIWLGLKPGMVVRVTRMSETAGEAPIYRLCIRG